VKGRVHQLSPEESVEWTTSWQERECRMGGRGKRKSKYDPTKSFILKKISTK